MAIWEYIVFGIVQGITEFLPISSSGHLVLMQKLFGFSGDFLFFAVLLHMATLFAVVVAMRSEVLALIKHPFSTEGKKIIIATIPTLLIVLIFKSFIDLAFEGSYLPFSFMFTGVLLVVASFLTKPKNKAEIKTSSAFLMGIAQDIAVIPGISRSGATICTGLMAGENRGQTARFSFLMSIPIIIASMAYEIMFSSQSIVLTASQIWGSLVAFVFALLAGILAIKFMLKIISSSKLWLFGIYLFLLSAVSLILI